MLYSVMRGALHSGLSKQHHEITEAGVTWQVSSKSEVGGAGSFVIRTQQVPCGHAKAEQVDREVLENGVASTCF